VDVHAVVSLPREDPEGFAMNRIVDRQMLVPNVHLLVAEAPRIARKIQPGQFVIVRPDEQGERTPLSVADWNEAEGTVTMVFLEVGRSTRKLTRLKAGDVLPTLVGPLGKPLDLDSFGTVACVGGCYGIGALFPVLGRLKSLGNRVEGFIEARSSFLLYWEDRWKAACDGLCVSTADGSRGQKGNNVVRIRERLGQGPVVNRVLAVGCTRMMHAVSEATRPFGVKTIVSLNPVMVDGTGMCGACRVEVGGKTLFACVDGPDFDGHAVNWDLVFSRRKAYMREETDPGPGGEQ
jgi:ferredoxin--NADP+ reductase